MVDSFSLINDGNKDTKNLTIVENKMNIDNIENKSIGIVKEQTQTEEASSSTNSSPLLSSLLQLGKSSASAASTTTSTANGQKYDQHYNSRAQSAIMGARGTNIGSEQSKEQTEIKHHHLHHLLHFQQNHEESSLMTQHYSNLKSSEKASVIVNSSSSTSNGSSAAATQQEANVNLTTATTSDKLVNNNNNNSKLLNCYESDNFNNNNNNNSNNNHHNLSVAAGVSSSNSNHSKSSVSHPVKSILENCLLKPSSVKSGHHHESQNKMEEKQQASTNYYNSTFQASSELSTESRKVEPLKINLHRQPIRTVIKVPPTSQQQSPESPPKITIKPIKPPENEIIPKITIRPVVNTTVSPTLSSSSTSSLSSGSSMENLLADPPGTPQKTIQVIPKLHIKNYTDSLGGNCEASEPYLVPKLVLRSVPTTPTTLPNQKHATVIVNNASSELIESNNVDAIPKITIKMDNHIGNANNGPGNHHGHGHHHHFNSNNVKSLHGHHSQSVLSKEGVKLTIKSIPEPAVPKLTIKTDSENMFVATATTVDSGGGNNQRCPSPIPKITIKSQQSSVAVSPKVTIKSIVQPIEKSSEQPNVPKLNIKPIPEPEQEAIPKLTIKTVSNSSGGADNSVETSFEKVVPKLVVKLPPKELQQSLNYGTEPGTESNSSSPSPSPPIVHKLNIKPIQPPGLETLPSEKEKEKEKDKDKVKEPVPKIHIKLDQPEATDHKKAAESLALSKFSIKSLIETPETPYLLQKPLEINTTSNKNSDSGLDSPRIILKINKTNKETITTEIIPAKQLSTNNSNDSLQSSPAQQNPSEQKQSEAPAATNAQNSSIINSSLVTNNISFNCNSNSNSNSNNNLVSGTKRAHPKAAAAMTDEPDMDTEIPRKLIKVMPSVTDEIIVLDDDSNSTDEDPEPAPVAPPKLKEPTKPAKEPVNSEKEKQPSISKLEENQKNLSRILTRIQRQRKAEDVVEDKPNSQHSDKLQNLLILNDGEGSSNDCIMIQDDPLRIDKSENSQDTLPDDEGVTKKRLRGRPRKPEKVMKPSPLVRQPSIVISPIKLDKHVVKKDNDNDDESSSESSSESDSETQESNDTTTTKSGTLNKSTPENNRIAAIKGRPRGRGRSKRTIEVIKDGKPVQITLDGHDDDDSPTFSIWNRSMRGGFGSKNRRGRGGRGTRGKRSVGNSSQTTPNRSRESSVFTTPQNRRHAYHASTPSLFEDDTLMSTGDCMQGGRMLEFVNNEDSQSSMFSSTGNTVEGSSRKRGKMEVCEPEGRTEFTIDMLAEYEWPQQLQHPSRETYMIQEQIAEYLGIKSFKRKYPDLMRRPVDMEERNFIYENGLASEKMCDLGVTAVLASEILDIMCNDYPDKYEEYKRYQREKQFSMRVRFREPVDKGQLQKDKALQSASNWNTQFNKDRKENRRCCMDLQNLIVQKPRPLSDNITRPVQPKTGNYPVALVPGQFAENYVKYTPEQLACYPINTVLVDYQRLENYLANHPNPYESSESDDSSDDEPEKQENIIESSSSESSESDNSTSDSEDEEMEDSLCKVCTKTQFSNKFSKPERLIKCSSCKNEAHPSCIEMPHTMYKRCLEYLWKCANCKTCSKCKLKRDNKMLFCDQCDRGFHIYCLGLRNVPEGRWHCDICTICTNCATKNPEGHPNPSLTHQQRQELSMIAHWTHEYTINKLTNIREHLATLCVPCSKKYKEKSPQKTDEGKI